MKNSLQQRTISLRAVKSANLVIEKITRVLSLSKRATLAQRAILIELAQYADLESLLMSSLLKAFTSDCASFSCDDMRKIRLVNINLNKRLRSFLKAAAYDLNYLEQYVEHDFWLELKNAKFLEQLAELERNMTSHC